MTSFAPPADRFRGARDTAPARFGVLRRRRHPLPIRVRLDGGRPVNVALGCAGLTGGRVTRAAGPWRTSGHWWMPGCGIVRMDTAASAERWNRDEWDVTLADGAVYRIYQDRNSDGWYLDAAVD
jgi:protein ImuB